MTGKQLFKIAPASVVLMTLFAAYFVLQWLLGVNIDAPTNEDLLAFGANYLPLTLHQPYRLLSSGFLHIGIVHLLFNGFAMYYFAIPTESLLGTWRFCALFFICVACGNMLNLYYCFWQWQQHGILAPLSAGASGAIMGMVMLLVVLSFSQRYDFLNKYALASVLGLNLLLGFAVPTIDNAGHIGGAIGGLLLGSVFAYYPKHYAKAACLLVLGLALAWHVLQQMALGNL